MNLRGKLVLITGAGRGIGLATALELSRAGARIVVAELDETTAQAGVTSIEERGGQAWPYVMDVSDRELVFQTIEDIERDRGPLDVVVNNAGIMLLADFLDHEPKQDARQFEINFFGVLNVMRAVLPRMKKRGGGHIVNIASLAGKFGVPNSAVYSASKHAVVGLTEAVRAENMNSGVRFSYVMPGVVDTELFSGATRPKWPPVSTPQDVGLAVRKSIEKGKLDVFVPKVARLSLYLRLFLPQFAQDRLSQLLGLAEVFGDVDRAKREDYTRRAMNEHPAEQSEKTQTDGQVHELDAVAARVSEQTSDSVAVSTGS